jgi:hypothetical protein
MNKSDGKFVVAGSQGPCSGLIWDSLDSAEEYRKLLLVQYPASRQSIYRLVLVGTEE